MEVSQKYVIDSNPVEEHSRFHGFVIYSRLNYSQEGEFLYFTQKGKVIQTLEITADCGQNVGYVDKVEFLEPKS